MRPEAIAAAGIERVVVAAEGERASRLAGLVREGFGQGVEVVACEQLAEALVALESPTAADAVLLDLGPEGGEGLGRLERLCEQSLETAIVVVSEWGDENTALAALAAGAQDFLEAGTADGAVLAKALRYASERTRIERELEHRAMYDPLTGLPNRSLFEDRLRGAIARSGRSGEPFAVLFADVNRFKLINDTLGHGVGDALLCEVAGRLKSALRPADTVARYGGDEFGFVLEGVEGAGGARRLADRVAEAVSSELLELAGRELSVEIAIGLVLGDGTSDPETVVRDADVAMYRAKAKGEAVTLFDSSMQASASERFEIEQGLRRAIDEGRLSLVYQPLINLDGGAMYGVEALLRWNDPVLGSVAPASFIPIAEELRLIEPIGRWVLHAACEQLASWRSRGLGSDLMLNVNVSPVELGSPEIVDWVAKEIDRWGIRPGQLCLEITESVLVAGITDGEQRLRELRELGARIAIDDFGTGYSSLDAIARFPYDYAKLDRGMIADLASDARRRRFLRGIRALATTLGVTPVAEGVETAEEADALRVLGCGLVQGYLFSRPVPPAEIEGMLARKDRPGLFTRPAPKPAQAAGASSHSRIVV
jgi:diguanylate cyclase (GGDEF)-like protein